MDIQRKSNHSSQQVLGLPNSQHLLVYKEGSEFHLQHKGKNKGSLSYLSDYYTHKLKTEPYTITLWTWKTHLRNSSTDWVGGEQEKENKQLVANYDQLRPSSTWKGAYKRPAHLMLRWSTSPAITNGRPLTALLYPTQGVITRTPRQHDKESEGNKRQVKLEKTIQPAHFSQMAQLPVAKAGTWRNFHD